MLIFAARFEGDDWLLEQASNLQAVRRRINCGNNKLAAYAKMSGREIAVALADVEVSPTWLA